jgi:hypothetical protein
MTYRESHFGFKGTPQVNLSGIPPDRQYTLLSFGRGEGQGSDCVRYRLWGKWAKLYALGFGP